MIALSGTGMVHRDLATRNILVFAFDATNPAATVVKITDFGLSTMRVGERLHDAYKGAMVGSPGYVAPEVIMKREYSSACDVWGLGVILYILLAGYPPFYDEDGSTAAIFKQIKAGAYEFQAPYWDPVSQQARAVVSGLMTVDAKERMTAEGVFSSPWIASDEHASSVHLPHFTANLKKYNAARKLKKAAQGIMAQNKMKKIHKSLVELAALKLRPL